MKRARSSAPRFQVAQKRPIDKNLLFIGKTNSAGQQTTDLVTATYPCTITGLRWDLKTIGGAGGNAGVQWAIVLVKDGNSANNIAVSDGSTFYEPEQNVLAFGNMYVMDSDAGTGNATDEDKGSTKTMRKLMGGDKLVFVTRASAANGEINGIVQFFCKS